MKSKKTITIDGREISFEEGQTIMDAAMAAGVYIPHLCHNPEFEANGSCRVCMVKVNGRFAAACTQPAQDGWEVLNNTDALRNLRRAVVQMLFVEANHFCPACEVSGNCQLQAVAYHLGMLEPHFKHMYPKRPIDASHSDVYLDHDRCILCELCVRASRDVDGKNVFAISGRAIDAHLIVNSPTGRLGDTNLDVNDKAVHVCPVGAILIKHRSYEMPIGERLYDRDPISEVGHVPSADAGRKANG